ncbi:MAG TPA: hypothetical protein VG889_09205 [Rhizomicrobium sp.]|nr:hypothetical protein [Rhizomicrobium sp.]
MKPAAALAVLVLLISGSADAQFVNPTCREASLRKLSRIDAKLGGRIVHPPLLRRCVDEYGESSLVTYSAVHLSAPGLCEYARYNARLADPAWRREADGGCPRQGHASYTLSIGVSRDEFLALSRFWRALKAGGAVPADDIVAHQQQRALAATMRRHLDALRNLLPRMSDRLRTAEANPDLSMLRIRLSPAEKRARKFKVAAGLGLTLYLVAKDGGFTIVGDYMRID